LFDLERPTAKQNRSPGRSGKQVGSGKTGGAQSIRSARNGRSFEIVPFADRRILRHPNPAVAAAEGLKLTKPCARGNGSRKPHRLSATRAHRRQCSPFPPHPSIVGLCHDLTVMPDTCFPRLNQRSSTAPKGLSVGMAGALSCGRAVQPGTAPTTKKSIHGGRGLVAPLSCQRLPNGMGHAGASITEIL